MLSVLPVASALYGDCVIEITPEAGVADDAGGEASVTMRAALIAIPGGAIYSP